MIPEWKLMRRINIHSLARWAIRVVQLARCVRRPKPAVSTVKVAERSLFRSAIVWISDGLNQWSFGWVDFFFGCQFLVALNRASQTVSRFGRRTGGQRCSGFLLFLHLHDVEAASSALQRAEQSRKVRLISHDQHQQNKVHQMENGAAVDGWRVDVPAPL